jgi:hypothetical protein
VICRLHGTRWARDPQFLSMVPYVVTDGHAITNVFGKVERFFEQGASEAPVMLLRMHADRDAVDGPVMFNVLAGIERVSASDIPLVALVRDLPNTVRTFARGTPDDSVAALVVEAEANLREVAVEISEIEGAETPVIVVHGSYYASEKLLDPAFLRTLHQRLGATLLLAAVPSKGQLWLTSAEAAPEHVGGFTAFVRARFQDAAPNERLSSEVMLVSDGRLSGVARATEAAGDA